MAISLYHIGLTLTAADRPAEAVPVITDSLRLWRRIGHRHGEARARQALAAAHIRLGEHAAAIDDYRAAVSLNQEAGDRRYQAAALTGLGDALYRAGHHREGRDARRQAAAILDELPVPDAPGHRQPVVTLFS
jgi:tetratricopeptide (TPR) repeat protein